MEPNTVINETEQEKLPKDMWLRSDLVGSNVRGSPLMFRPKSSKISGNIRSAMHSAANVVRSALWENSPRKDGFETLSAKEDDPKTIHYKKTDGDVQNEVVSTKRQKAKSRVVVIVCAIALMITGFIIGYVSTDNACSPPTVPAEDKLFAINFGDQADVNPDFEAWIVEGNKAQHMRLKMKEQDL